MTSRIILSAFTICTALLAILVPIEKKPAWMFFQWAGATLINIGLLMAMKGR